jgi:hypothetical protein
MLVQKVERKVNKWMIDKISDLTRTAEYVREVFCRQSRSDTSVEVMKADYDKDGGIEKNSTNSTIRNNDANINRFTRSDRIYSLFVGNSDKDVYDDDNIVNADIMQSVE